MLSKRTWTVVVVSLVAVMVLAACGGAAVTTQEAAPTTLPPATEALMTEEPMAAEAAPTEPPAAEVMPTEAMATEAMAPEAQASATPAGVSLGAGEIVYKLVPGESTVSYEVGETFLDQNRFATAVGVTSEVNGEIALDFSNPQAARLSDITVDISQLASDSGRRDGALRDRFLLSSQFPIATFTPTSIEGLPAGYTPGEEITFKIAGNLTVRETTMPVVFDVIAKVQDGALTGTATSMIKMSDFGVGPISMAMLRTEDDVKLTMVFVARP